MKLVKVLKSTEFDKWFVNQSDKIQALIEARIFRIEFYQYLGDLKYINGGLAELRWKNGLRLYFCKINLNMILLLIGGYKNAQKSDIKKARNLLKKYTESEIKKKCTYSLN